MRISSSDQDNVLVGHDHRKQVLLLQFAFSVESAPAAEGLLHELVPELLLGLQGLAHHLAVVPSGPLDQDPVGQLAEHAGERGQMLGIQVVQPDDMSGDTQSHPAHERDQIDLDDTGRATISQLCSLKLLDNEPPEDRLFVVFQVPRAEERSLDTLETPMPFTVRTQ